MTGGQMPEAAPACHAVVTQSAYTKARRAGRDTVPVRNGCSALLPIQRTGVGHAEGQPPMSQPIVLVIDDDPMIRLLICRTLLRCSSNSLVFSAGTVAEARHALGVSTPTLVLTDYHLPDGTGADILAAARQQEARLPVIVISGNISVREAMLDAGATGFIAKPFGFSEFADVIAAALAR